MSLKERVELYKKIELARKRPLIIYVTSTRPRADATMAADAVGEIVAQLDMLPESSKELDLLIASNGGDPTVACRIVTLIRERVDKFSVLIPSVAFSAATLVALGADEIVMHRYGNLGPVDPQIQVQRPAPNGAPMQMRFGSEDLAAFLAFAKNKVGLTDQEQLTRVFELFCKEVGTVPIGVAARSAQLSLSMGQKLLQTHLPESDEQKIKAIARKLSEDFYHHGYALGRKEAKGVGLNVAASNASLESLIWAVWLDLEEEMELRRMFHPIELVHRNPAAAALFSPIQQVVLPNGQPSQAMPVQVPATPFELLHAVVESTRHATRYKARGLIFASRAPDLQMPMNVIQTSMGWETVSIRPHIVDVKPDRVVSKRLKKKVATEPARESVKP